MTMVQLQVCDNQERGSRANNPHIMDETIAALEAFFASPINIFVIILIIFDALVLWWFPLESFANSGSTVLVGSYPGEETRPISCLRQK